MGTWWATELEKRSNGRVKVDYYFSQALVKSADSLDAITHGIADVQFIASGYFPTKLPLVGGLDLIYQTESYWVISMAFKEMCETYEPFQKMYRDNNIVLVAPNCASEVCMAANTPIKTLEDLQGKKMRAFGLMNDAMKMLGATAVAMPLPEVYEALERGTLDGATGFPYHLLTSFKIYEVAKYITDPGIGCYATGGYFMNLDVWDKLPDDIRSIINELYAEYPTKRTEIVDKELRETTDTMIAAGNEIYCLPPEEVARWKAKVVPMIYDDWVEKMEAQGYDGREVLDIYQKLVEKYTPLDKYQHPYPCDS